jgi:nitrite reductase/ring-hydroxylating ferredoxin subunit/multimeric flavodoxin WrbA
MAEPIWVDLGPVEDLKKKTLAQLKAGRTPIALTYRDGEFSAVSGVCNHVGGPLGEGRLDGDYLVCPWHNYKFHYRTGEGEPGYEEDRVPSYDLKTENGHLFVNTTPKTPRHKVAHDPHPLERPIVRAEGPTRVLGISTTAMDVANPRYSTSDALLEEALAHASSSLQAETKLLRLTELAFRSCEGYYSKSAHACTWPCSITQMDPQDQMDRVYEAIIFWADVILVSTPIRWGQASSLYFKMVERMNCVQNQITLRDRVMIRNKVAAFIITGGQDNIQAVAGDLLGFFAEIGCLFPQFPYIAHSRGWSAEDMENNISYVQKSKALKEGAQALVTRAVEVSKLMCATCTGPERFIRAGRKADGLDNAAMGAELLAGMADEGSKMEEMS